MTIRRMSRLPALLALLVAAAAVLAACGSSSSGGSSSSSSSSSGSSTTGSSTAGIQRNPANAKTTIVVGSKNFTEEKVLGEVYAQAFQAAGYKVQKQLNLGDEQTALKAMKSNQISGYPEYTGTVLLSFLSVPAAKLPTDSQQAYDQVKAGMAKQSIIAEPQAPYTNSNAVAVTTQTAQRLGLKTISDLKGKSQNLTLYGTPECRTRRDCLLGLEQVYGLKFKKFVPVNPDQRHEVLKNGQADVSIVFGTDPQIAREHEVILQDDKHMFPPYSPTFLVRSDVAGKAGPDLAKTIEAVNKNLTAPVIQELNARVDLDKDTPAAAATAYLKQYKLV